MGGGNQNTGGVAVRANPIEDALKWMLAPQVTPEQTDAWFNPPQPSVLPSPPLAPETRGGRLIDEFGRQLQEGFLPPQSIEEIKRDPASMKSLAAYAGAAAAIGGMMGGEKGGKLPKIKEPPPPGAGIEQTGGQGVKAVMKLTGGDAQEVLHKFNVLADSPELHESYNLSADQAKSLRDSIPESGQWEVPQWGRRAARGELEDHIGILREQADNARSDGELNEARRLNRQALRLEQQLKNFND